MKIIYSLNSKNSSGFDGISTNLLKLIKEVTKPITLLINQCLKKDFFPEHLKLAKVFPLFNKDDKSNIANYRPIPVLPSISKIFEKVIFEQLNKYFISNNLFFKSQYRYGFRVNHSTELAALHLFDSVTNEMDRGIIPINKYLDLSKAFDTLDHSILLSKLEYYSIKNSELSLFKNYLLNRKQFVQMGEISSTTQTIKTGVPQGFILGPLLFIIYINDLRAASDFLQFIIYADDTIFFCSLNPRDFDKIEDLSIILNIQIQVVKNWLKVNKLSLNI